MYEYLQGKLVSKYTDHAIIDVGGVGYRVKTSFSTFQELPEPGQMVKIHTYLHVREDTFELLVSPRPWSANSFIN